MLNSDKNQYIDKLKKRKDKGKGRVNHSHQFTGLNIAKILEDQEHKSLYIKLAKKHNENFLLRLAKDVADRPNINNKGAYFMKLLKKKLEENKN